MGCWDIKGAAHMKRISAFLLAFLLMLSLAACQENPEGSIVVHKDMDNLISLAQKDDPEKVDVTRIAQEVRDDFSSYSTFLEDDDLGVVVTANANVDIPEVDKLSVYRVRQKKFDQEFVDKVRKVLMGDKTVYESAALGQWTKADWERSIKTYRDLLRQTEEELAGGEPTTYGGPPLTQEEWEEHCRETIEFYQEEIDRMQERYEAAPTEADHTRYPSEGKLHTKKELAELLPDLYSLYHEWEAETESLSIAADASDGTYQMLEVENSEDKGNILCYSSCPDGYLYLNWSLQPLDPSDAAYTYAVPQSVSVPEDFLPGGNSFPEGAVFAPLENDETTITEEEALNRAEDFLREIGLSDFALDEGGLFHEYAALSSQEIAENPAYRRYYILRFRRELGGVLLAQASGGKRTDINIDGEESYRAQVWPEEVIELRINDAGIAGFVYQAPLEVTETVVENAGMKSFATVKDTFEKMACMVGDPEDQQLALSADIDRVRLSYSRISEKDDFDSGLIVPVWSFEGDVRYGFHGEFGPGTYKSLLTVNAIDGSIIDGTLGY